AGRGLAGPGRRRVVGGGGEGGRRGRRPAAAQPGRPGRRRADAGRAVHADLPGRPVADLLPVLPPAPRRHHLFPSGRLRPPGPGPRRVGPHLLLPWVTLAAVTAATYSRLTRS